MVPDVAAWSLSPVIADAEPEAPIDAPLMHAGVYRDLRYRFLTGQIMPDANLSTRGLAQQLGVSQTPVREALSRLAAEGAVADPLQTPNRHSADDGGPV